MLLTLFERVIAEADAAFEGRPTDYAVDPRRDMARRYRVFFERFGAHHAACAGRYGGDRDQRRDPRLLVDIHAEVDRSHRRSHRGRTRRGTAPDTVPAQDLATALNLMNERAMFASFTAEKPAIAEDAALDTLVHIWITSIYGESR